MIKKQFRLNEMEVKKVLRIWKPFFSYWIVLNKIKSKLPYNRFGIVIWAKSVNHNITRNFCRRRFYDVVNKKIEVSDNAWYDIVFVVKKKMKLNMSQNETITSFDNDLKFLIKKINS